MFEEIPHWTNREAIATETIPGSLLVVGGGPVGLEIGQVMARFGAAVTIVEMDERLASTEEPEVSELITDILRREGVTVHGPGCVSCGVESQAAGGCTAHFADGSSATAERVLVATGRRSDLGGLGVAALGLDASAHSIPADARMRVLPGVWAVGDVTGKGAFTHVAMYQARICVADILGQEVAEADYRAVPRVTFTDPEIGSVGLTEAAARRVRRRGHRDARADLGLCAGVDQQGRRAGQVGRTGRSTRRGDLHGPIRRRGPRPVGARRPCPDSRGHIEEHDLRLPDLSPGDRFGLVVLGGWAEPLTWLVRWLRMVGAWCCRSDR